MLRPLLQLLLPLAILATEPAGLEAQSERIGTITLASGLDDAGALARALADRALTLSRRPAAGALFLVAHGPNSAEESAVWLENLRRAADSVRRMTGFRDVRVGLIQDDAPAAVRAEAVLRIRELIELEARATREPVVVGPGIH